MEVTNELRSLAFQLTALTGSTDAAYDAVNDWADGCYRDNDWPSAVTTALRAVKNSDQVEAINACLQGLDDGEWPDTCLDNVTGHWFVITYGRAPYQIHSPSCATCQREATPGTELTHQSH